MDNDNKPDGPNLERVEESFRLLHAIQSGIATAIEQFGEGEAGVSPKHLRVGIDNALVGHTALIQALVDRRVITWDGFYDSYLTHLRAEVERVEKMLSDRLGATIKLG
jgi:hypothetical protein